MTTPSPVSPVVGPDTAYAEDRLTISSLGALRPLGQVLRDLPRQYRRVLWPPSAESFARELPQAEWRSVWVQLLGWGLVSAIVGFITWLFHPAPTLIFVGPAQGQARVYLPPAPYGGQLLSVPLGFFFSMALLYLAARLFGGQGTFLAQSYASVLAQAPLGALASVLVAIPYLGFLAVILYIYEFVLQIFAIRAAHRVGGGRAVVIVLVPTLVLVALAIIVATIFAVGLVAALLT